MKETLTDKWCYSEDGEWFSGDFDTEDEAIEEAMENTEYDEIFVGNLVKISIEDDELDIAEDIIEKLQDIAGDNYGECTEGFLDVEQKHIDELNEKINAVLINWINEHGYQPKFYQVENIKKIKIRNENGEDNDNA